MSTVGREDMVEVGGGTSIMYDSQTVLSVKQAVKNRKIFNAETGLILYLDTSTVHFYEGLSESDASYLFPWKLQ